MTFSKLVRRTHMYLALFLAPWILGYAVSTVAMNHQWTGGPPSFIPEREQAYATRFAPGTPPLEMGRQILADLGLEGAYGVQGSAEAGRLVINRQDLVTPRRIVFTPADQRLVVERAEFQSGGLLNRFHRRRGYQQPYAADRLMAASVDAVIVAMVFWGLSGLWMWWEMRATRWWGLASMAAGLALFGGLVFAI
jgi:hypothetical protein